MVQHVHEAFPKHSGFLGESGIQEVVRYGVKQGRACGFTWQGPVTLFIDLTLLLGRSFDVDVQLPWAASILGDVSFPDQLARAERLHAAAIEYLDMVSGPENEFIDAAQRRLTQESLEIRSGSAESLAQEILTRLQRIWPEKYDHVGSNRLHNLVRLGMSSALRYRLEPGTGALLYTIMMYVLGSGFNRDPLFAWAQRVLEGESRDQVARVEQLYAEGINYLKQWCV